MRSAVCAHQRGAKVRRNRGAPPARDGLPRQARVCNADAQTLALAARRRARA